MLSLNGVPVACSLFVALIGSATLLAILAAIAGTGGGSLFLPLFSLPLSDVHFAVPLSKTAVLGTAIGASVVNYVDPNHTGDLINYRLVTLIQPATLLGCTCGVLLNLWFPSPVITSLMILILGFTAHKTFQHADKIDKQMGTLMAQRQKARLENLAFESQLDSEPLIKVAPNTLDEPIAGQEEDLGSVESLVPFLSAISAVASPRMQISTQVSSASPSFTSSQIKSPGSPEDFIVNAKHNSFLLEPSGFILSEVLAMAACWAVNLVTLLFAGSPAALVCGTPGQKAWIVGGMCFLILFIILTYMRLTKSHDEDSPEARAWLTPKSALIYTGLSYLAGVGAALLGIGGGLIKSPLLIAIGLKPVSAVAT